MAPKTIDEYLAGFSGETGERLAAIRAIVSRLAPEAEEAIVYGIPTFRLNGNLVHFAGFKNHIGFYPTPTGIEAFRDRLTAYEHAKGSVKFPLSEPLPETLIEDIVKFRIAEAAGHPTRRPKKNKEYSHDGR